MIEQFEKNEERENLENQKYNEFQVAEEEEGRILKAIDDVFSKTPDRKEAERIVLEKYGPLMDKAIKKSGEALRDWLNEIKEGE